ncbi:hypothetical protein, partial [Desulfobulbus propionicus]
MNARYLSSEQCNLLFSGEKRDAQCFLAGVSFPCLSDGAGHAPGRSGKRFRDLDGSGVRNCHKIIFTIFFSMINFYHGTRANSKTIHADIAIAGREAASSLCGS